MGKTRDLFKNVRDTKGAQLCLTLCYPMDCSPLGSSVHGIFRINPHLRTSISSALCLQQILMSFQSGLCKDETHSCGGAPRDSAGSGATEEGLTSRRYRAWAQSWSSADLAACSVLPTNRPATPLFSPACWELGFQAWVKRSLVFPILFFPSIYLH